MALVDELSFHYQPRNAAHRAIGRLVSTPLGSWIGKWAVPALDRLVFRFTRGKATAVGWLAGLPMVWLTTVGRRSGARRRQPLLAFPFEHDLAIIGSNFGQRHHPGWALNLEANSEAHLEHRGSTVGVKARRAVGGEIERIWLKAIEHYPGYARYRAKVSTREIRLFILEKA